MIKKTITYTDYNGLERTEDFYFNLTQSEIVEWQWGTEGGLLEVLEKMSQSVDIPKIMGYYKEIILRSYGEKSEDGKRFIKSPELSKAFSETEAYDQLYMSMFPDADKMAEFVKGILPKDFGPEFDKELSKLEAGVEVNSISETN